MCGIVGAIGKNSRKDLLKKSLDSIKHRGPDGEGIFVDEIDNIALGHRRLAIIDLSEDGKQPFISNDSRYVIVFNGEIYNYIELKEELKSEYDFKTKTDTEVLLASYIKWGVKCLDRFNGMFAFAIWDKEKKELFCARDRLGIKPFYYYKEQDCFCFGSEIKALLKLGVPAKENDEIIFDYLYYGFYDHSDNTFFRGIKKLPAGNYLFLKNNKIDIKRYWDLNKPVYDYSNMSSFDIKKEFERLLSDSIKLRFRSDVPVGLNLSSGLDSNSLFYFSENYLNIKNINIFSMSLPSKEYDECGLIEGYLSDNQKQYWHKSELNPRDVFSLARTMNTIQDEPYGGIPTIAYLPLNKKAKEMNIKVLLEGQGVDEILGGYKYYELELKKDLIRQKASADIYSFDYSQDMTKLIDVEILDDNYVSSFKKNLRFDEKFNSNLLNAQYRDITCAKLPRVLRFNDHVSMNYGIELRLPYLDYRIVEFCFWLPSDYKIKNNVHKKLLRDIMSDKIPKIVKNSGKKAFGAVQTEWFRKYFKEEIKEVIYSSCFRGRKYWNNKKLEEKVGDFFAGKGDNSFFIWQCINLEFWLEEFIDS